jgi:hypothetical protein
MLRSIGLRLSKSFSRRLKKSRCNRSGFNYSRSLRAESLEDRRLLSVSTLWAKQLGTSSSDYSYGVSADGLGNVYISGDTNGSLGGTNAGGVDAFVGKYDASGTLLWTKQLGTSSSDSNTGVSADGLGNVYISGFTGGSLGGTNAGGYDAFVSKYDASGTLVWTKQLGTASDDFSTGVSADGLGNVYISGSTNGSLGGTNAGSRDAFVSKYDASGTLLWTKQLGTSSVDDSTGVSADGLGNVYISGYTSGSLGGANAGSNDAFVSKYDASGTLLWTQQLGTSSNDFSTSVSFDGLGNVYISGETSGSLGGTHAGSGDAFVSKYSASGTLLWSKQLGTSSTDSSKSVSADGLGNVYISGFTDGNLGSTNPGSHDVFVSKYDATGTLLWTKQYGTSSLDVGSGVSADGLGDVYISGETDGNLWGTHGGLDAIVVRIDEPFLVNTTADTVDAILGDGLAADASGNTSLRAAIQEANALGGSTIINLPAGTYSLTRTGSESSAYNDLDITGNITIVGDGPGLTVINAAALNSDGVGAHDRIFEVNGASAALDLSGVTLTGATTSATGGAVYVTSGATVDFRRVAFVGNTSTGAAPYGGALRIGGGTIVSVRDSVFTNNVASYGAAIYVNAGSSNLTTLTIGSTVFGKNTASTQAPNVYGENDWVTYVNEGNNVSDNNNGNRFLFNAGLGDVIDTVTSASALIIVTDISDNINSGNDVYARSLREAVIAANSSNDTVWLPAWKHRLTIAGSESSTSTNDLDITGDVTIVGTGAGLSIIDAFDLNSDGVGAHDRIFEVNGASAALDLSGVTLTGATTSATGGAVYVTSGATVDFRRVAFVGNTSTGAAPYGGALRIGGGTIVSVRDSVFTNNVASYGAAIYVNAGSSNLTTLTIGSTVFGKNTASTQAPNVYGENDWVTYVNEGNNVSDNNNGNRFLFNAGLGDVIDTTTPSASLYVVISVADTYDDIDNTFNMSLRDAVRVANITSGANTIWLPAWLLLLTREGTDGSTNDVSKGDLDVTENLTIRGVNSKTTVDAQMIVDVAFQTISATLTHLNVTVND